MAASVSKDLKLIPLILRNETNIDIERSIDKLHGVLLRRKRIRGILQLILRHSIDQVLVGVNHFVQPRIVTLPDILGDSSSDSLNSSSESPSAFSPKRARYAPEPPPDSRDSNSGNSDGKSTESIGSSSPISLQEEENVDINAAAEPPVVPPDEEMLEVKPHLKVPADFIQETPDFRKYVDQIREELLALFVPEITNPSSQNFPSHVDLKLAFAIILRAAGIWRKREYNEIIVLP